MPPALDHLRDSLTNAAEVGPLANLMYLVAAVLFIYGMKGMTHPRTAVRGNLLGALGMLLAIVVTILHLNILPIGVAAIGMTIGGAIGLFMALKVQMTQMPQFVALFNGFGGLASLLVAGVEALKGSSPPDLTRVTLQGDRRKFKKCFKPWRVESIHASLPLRPLSPG